MPKSLVRVYHDAKKVDSSLYSKAIQEFCSKMGGTKAVLHQLLAEDTARIASNRDPIISSSIPEDAHRAM